MKKKILKIIAMVLVAISIVPSVNFAEVSKPMVTVDPSAEIPEYVAGEEITIAVPLQNISRHTAKNVIARITTDAKELPFMVDKAVFSTEIPYVRRNGDDTAIIYATISPSAKTQIYKIDFEFTYTNVNGEPYSSTGSYYIKISNRGIEPTLGVVNYSFLGEEISAGNADGISLVIENKGTVSAYNARIKLEGFSKDGVQLLNDIDTKDILEIANGESEKIAYSIIAASDAKTDTYELTATIKYTDELGKEYETKSLIYVPVNGKDSNSIELEIKNLSSTEKVKAGQEYKIKFDLDNVGKIEAEKMLVSVKYPENFTPIGSPKKTSKNVKPGDINSYEFTFLAKQEAETGFNDFYINVEYYANASNIEDKGTFEEYCGVMVDGKSGLGRPKIIVRDYEIVDSTVAMAGQEFTLKVNFYNTSSSDVVKNIKVSMQSDDGVFSPVDSSSSFFINNIGVQGEDERLLKFKTKTDAAVKVYNITLTMEYEDGKGNAYDSQEQPYKEEEKLGIQVSQPIRLETAEPMIPQEAYVGSPADIEVEFYNMGKSTMYNMMVKLEGNFQVQGSNYFVGNFDSGRSEFFSATMIPETEGEAVGKLIFEFEDALGNLEKVEKDISYFVMAEGGSQEFPGESEFPGGEFPDGMEDEQAGMSKGKIFGIVIGVLAILSGGLFYYKKKQKSKKLLAEIVEDEDE